ncbi:MAG: hypothetical protein U0893_17295 [Chloroflexota bacterium]
MSDYTHERILRGIPRWLLCEYLEQLGGEPLEAAASAEDGADEDVLAGDGWQARLTQMEDHRVGPLRSEQVRLLVTGNPDEVRGMLSRLAPRLGRGG